jgi:hypothetical protein
MWAWRVEERFADGIVDFSRNLHLILIRNNKFIGKQFRIQKLKKQCLSWFQISCCCSLHGYSPITSLTPDMWKETTMAEHLLNHNLFLWIPKIAGSANWLPTQVSMIVEITKQMSMRRLLSMWNSRKYKYNCV